MSFFNPNNVSFIRLKTDSNGSYFSNGHTNLGFTRSVIEGFFEIEGESNELWFTVRKTPTDESEYFPQIMPVEELEAELEKGSLVSGVEGEDQFIFLTQLTDETGNLLKKDIWFNNTSNNIGLWRVKDKYWLYVSDVYFKFINPISLEEETGFKDYRYIDVTDLADDKGYVAIGNKFEGSATLITQDMQDAIDEWETGEGAPEINPNNCIPNKVWVWSELFTESLEGIKNEFGYRPTLIININSGVVWSMVGNSRSALSNSNLPYPLFFQG